MMIGRTIGSYQILAQIASGGQAVVYRARHVVLQREDALKILHAHLISAPDFVEKFGREAQVLAHLKHRNVVEVYTADRDAATGAYFIAMELLPGDDLETLIARQGRLGVDVTVNAARQVASALEYAHTRGLIHRDIKPSNIILMPDGRCKVLDFGIAAIVAAGQKAKTRIGTVEYMSPEHYVGNADARSDIYSLGATLYHCLTGELPPVLASQPPTPPRQLNPSVSPALGNVILKTLSSDPAKRQQTAREFITDIDNAVRTPQIVVSAPAAMQCMHCGAQNRVSAKHCASCGRAMTVPKTYTGPLKVRMGDRPLIVTQNNEPHYYWSPRGHKLLVTDSSFSFGEVEARYPTLEVRHLKQDTDKDCRISEIDKNSRPSWSPDGSQIAYTRYDRLGKGQIWIAKIIPGRPTSTQVTFSRDGLVDPAWSPDGEYLACSTIGKKWQILRLATGKMTPCDGQISVGWSPTKSRFGCLNDEPNGKALYVFERASLTEVPLNSYGLGTIERAEWLTDSQIAVSHREPGMQFRIQEFEGYRISLLDLNARSCRLNWLPARAFVVNHDRSRIAGVSDDLQHDLVWADVNHEFRRLPITGPLGTYKDCWGWSLDSTKILFDSYDADSHASGIYVVNIDDTGLQHLAEGSKPEYSPDGKYIAFGCLVPRGAYVHQERKFEVWAMQVE